jgi:O-antigen ligase
LKAAGGAPQLWEQAISVLILFLSTNAVFPLLRQGTTLNTTNRPDPTMQAVWFGIYVVTLLLFLGGCKRTLWKASSLGVLWLLVGLAFASTAWSDVPGLTFQRSIALLGTTIFGVYLGIRYSPAQLLRLVAWTFALSAFASLLFSILLPSYGVAIDTRGEAWRGAYTTKGQLGRLMALATIFWLLYLRTNRHHALLKGGLLLLSVALLLLSESQTSVVVLIVLVAFLPLLKMTRWHYSMAVTGIASALSLGTGLVVWVSSNFDDLVSYLGRDPTLTGRTLLWESVWEKIKERPFLGYGYSGFWRGWDGPSGDIWLVTGWDPPHAHNGLLDLWLQLGLVGVVLFLVMIVSGIGRALVVARDLKGVEGEFPLLFLLFIVVSNATEVSILLRNSIYWVLCAAFLIQLAAARSRSRVDSQQRQPRVPAPVLPNGLSLQPRGRRP